MGELAVLIGQTPDGAHRQFLEDCFWTKAAARDGVLIAHWHRQEYEQLRGWRQRRLDEIGRRPALGAYRKSTGQV